MTAIYAHRGNVAFPAGQRATNGPPCGMDVPGDIAFRENTVEAFDAARRADADGIELDVRLTADDLPVIHHDRRLPDGRELANIAHDSLPHSVPSLQHALLACNGLSVNVEVKQDDGDPRRRTAAAVAALLGQLLRPAVTVTERASDPELPPVLVSSFDEDSLVLVRERQPTVPLGLLIDWRTPPAAGLGRAAALGCATLHPFVTQVDRGLVEAAGDAGLGLHVWTVNAHADLLAMAALGVAAVITDQVTAAVRLLRPSNPPNGGAVTG
jgi:glycerophosphoryl diester phosphodiesterase